MKTQIDNLVRGILHDLAQPSSGVPEVDVYFKSIGADGLSKAVEQRAILASWIEDMSFALDVRQYAQEQLDALPCFDVL